MIQLLCFAADVLMLLVTILVILCTPLGCKAGQNGDIGDVKGLVGEHEYTSMIFAYLYVCCIYDIIVSTNII